MRLTEEERARYKDLEKRYGRPLSSIIREALDTIHTNPDLLNPTTSKTDFDILLQAYELTANERLDREEKSQNELLSEITKLNQKVNFLLKKARISKKEIQKIEGLDMSGESIFE